MAGEFDFIRWIVAQHRADDFVRVPPGDDLAVLDWPATDALLVGIDQVLDGVHFDSGRHTPQQIGAKVVNRNLSDCAAMACLPAALVASVALPRGAGEDYARALYRGMHDAAAGFGCRIVGGDTGAWDGKLVATVAILGRSDGLTPITRNGARPGDSLYVTGPLGGSILGRHMTFTPRVNEARQLAAAHRITAMIDISDGLSRDLGHICRQSGMGAEVDAHAVPIHDDALILAAQDHKPALWHALHDGEDHELLFTSPDMILGAIRIGQITRGDAMTLCSGGVRTPLEERGWQHQL
jgi:thiamine-monophosphate kinase